MCVNDSRYRLSQMLRGVPGRLAEASFHLRNVLRINSTHGEAKQLLDEVVEELRERAKPQRTWHGALLHLGSVLVVLCGAAVFFMPEIEASIFPQRWTRRPRSERRA